MQAEKSVGPQRSGRRRFMLGGLATLGTLVVGWGVMPARQRLDASHPLPLSGDSVALNGWLALAGDGSVTLAMPRSEMGQGVSTALSMLVAEELDVPLAAIRLVQAPHDRIFGNVAVFQDGLPFHPDNDGNLKSAARWMVGKVARELGLNLTGGSSSVKDAWLPMRTAGASARAMLLEAAARQWQAGVADCRTEAGWVLHRDGRRLAYGALAASAAGIAPQQVVLKNARDFRLIGRSQPRRDSPSKVNGRAMFGLDVRLPGMLYAALRMPPVLGAEVARVDSAAALQLPGVVQVVDISAALPRHSGTVPAVAVLARSYWQARQAAQLLEIEWRGGAGTLDSAQLAAQLHAALDRQDGFVYHERGSVQAQSERATRQLVAEYHAPFLAHAAMEPVNCTAQVRDGQVRLWAPTQSPSFAIAAAAKAAGVAEQQVQLEVTLLGGSFGRKLDVDMVTQVVALACQAGGAPVQMIWSREDDMGHDFYRPAAMARYTASLDAAGRVLGLACQSAGASVGQQFLQRNLGLPPAGPDKTTAEGLFDMPYEFPHQRIRHAVVEHAVPVGNWRSVGHSHNAFFKECLIDELAQAAGQDGVAYRRALLQQHPRHRAVLDAAVARAGTAPAGRAHGVALHQSFGSIVAQVAEVSLEAGRIRVHKVVCALDCGMAVNPDGIAQQVESGVLFGLSAALYGTITIKDGKIEQRNFHDYPVLRMDQAPQVETVILPSLEAPEGMGEPATPPVAPAVANAVFRLTGQRLRSLPLTL